MLRYNDEGIGSAHGRIEKVSQKNARLVHRRMLPRRATEIPARIAAAAIAC